LRTRLDAIETFEERVEVAEHLLTQWSDPRVDDPFEIGQHHLAMEAGQHTEKIVCHDGTILPRA
jgi:hypothetical protein